MSSVGPIATSEVVISVTIPPRVTAIVGNKIITNMDTNDITEVRTIKSGTLTVIVMPKSK